MRRGLPWAALLVALILYPFVDRALGFQTVHAVSDGMIYVLLALGLNIVVGYAGLLDLGYAAFFAIGAYSMGLLNSPVLGSPLYGHPWSFWLCIWLAAAVSALLGVGIGAPTLRVRGHYLAIITLGFGEIIPVAIRNLGDITIELGSWRPIERLNLTGGENGVNPIGRPYLPGVPFETDPVPWYFLILIIGAASLWAMNRLRDSRLGRAWMAIREDETAADCTGVNPVSTKLLAFALLRPRPGPRDAAAARGPRRPATATDSSRRRLCGCSRPGGAAARRSDPELAARSDARRRRRARIGADSRDPRADPALRRHRRAQRRQPGRAARRDRRAHRPQRRRQDDALQRRDRAHPAGRRPDHVRGHESGAAPPERDRCPRHRPHVPVDPALPADDRAGERARRRALPPRRERGRGRAATAGGGERGGPGPPARARAAHLRRPGRQRG